MKKSLTLLWLTLTAFTFSTSAQTNICNAEFSVQFLTSTSIKFNPVINVGAPTYQHVWVFGDGSPSSNLVSPTHAYAAAGTYTSVHTIIRFNPNNIPECTQSFTKIVVIQTPCNLQANFISSVTTLSPLTVQFHNTSIPSHSSDSVKWTFGDGTSLSGLQSDPNIANPVHTYNQAGSYNVCIRVKQNNNTTPNQCLRESCKTIVVAEPCTLVANFTSQPDPNHPLRIKFTNTSVPSHATDSVRWTFGDGSSVSGLQGDPNIAAPTHNYLNAGSYTVCIRVKKNNTVANYNCVREFCKTVVVTIPCNLQVYFTSQPDPNHPLRIKFTNQSVPSHATDSLYWTFGDGTSVSGVQADPNVNAPTHNYTSTGTYTVCLRVKKNGNTTSNTPCVREYCKTIVIPPHCNIQPGFTWRLDSANQLKVYFSNTTAAPTATSRAFWTFGDGGTANTWNAVHQYAQPGHYRVCVKIEITPNCIREFCDTIFVPHPIPQCTQLSKFRFEKSNTDNQLYKFTPDYINTTLQYTWTFGDGTGSHDPIAVHRYAQPGVYTTCLTVWRGPNCASTTCKEIVVRPQIICDTAHVGFTYQRNTQVPNRVSFYASATLPILDQTWTITRLPASNNYPPVILHQNNPTYTFQDTGYYKVCLRAVLLGGCVKEFCSVIKIEQVTNVCLLQAYPNPATSYVNVNVYLQQPEMIHAYVYTSQNVLVRDKHQQGHSGNNIVNLNVNGLPAGQYLIKLVYGNRVCYARFEKL